MDKIKTIMLISIVVIAMWASIATFFAIENKQIALHPFECQEEADELCAVYNMGLSPQAYVSNLELDNMNCDFLVSAMDDCITSLTGRNDTLVVCGEVLN